MKLSDVKSCRKNLEGKKIHYDFGNVMLRCMDSITIKLANNW
jgi:hypothetical protein